jgi:transcription termination factor NusB
MSSNPMWSNSLRQCVFFAVYQSIFNQSINAEFHISNYNMFVETISSEHPEIFLENLNGELNDFEKNLRVEIEQLNPVNVVDELEAQMNIFYVNSDKFTNQIKEHLSDWSKTFGIVKAILYCFLLEKIHTDNNSEFATKSVGIYIKLSEEFTILANIKLIHAILSKLQNENSSGKPDDKPKVNLTN